jgi:acetyl-CoA carboxylase carboxyltransferase component
VQRHRRSAALGNLKRFAKGDLMSEFERKGQRFVALCMFGMLLFNYPILALFNVSGTLFGVPVLYAYIFIAWAVLIALMASIAESGS